MQEFLEQMHEFLEQSRFDEDELQSPSRTESRPSDDQEDEHTLSVDLLERFRSLHRLEMPKEQFVGLCAYLVALLRRGFDPSQTGLDMFILRYPAYQALLPSLQQRQLAATIVRIPSYHRWLQAEEPAPENANVEPILSVAGLRRVWRENPYTFLRVDLSMDLLGGREGSVAAGSLPAVQGRG